MQHATKRPPPQGILSQPSIGRLIQLLQFLNSSITPINRPTDLSCTRVQQNTNQLQSRLLNVSYLYSAWVSPVSLLSVDVLLSPLVMVVREERL